MRGSGVLLDPSTVAFFSSLLLLKDVIVSLGWLLFCFVFFFPDSLGVLKPPFQKSFSQCSSAEIREDGNPHRAPEEHLLCCHI